MAPRGDSRPSPLQQWRTHRTRYGLPTLIATVAVVLLVSPLERMFRAMTPPLRVEEPAGEDPFDPDVRLVELESPGPTAANRTEAQVQRTLPTPSPSGSTGSIEAGVEGTRMDWALDPTTAYLVAPERRLALPPEGGDVADSTLASTVLAEAMSFGSPLDTTSPHALALAADIRRRTEPFLSLEADTRPGLRMQWQREADERRIQSLWERVVMTGVEPQ